MEKIRWAVVLMGCTLTGVVLYSMSASLGQQQVQGEVVRRQVVVGGWGSAIGQFGLYKEEGAFGPPSFAIDAAGRVYVADIFNRRVQVFAPDGSSLRAITAGGEALMPLQDMYVSKDGTIYGTDAWLVFMCAAEGDRFERLPGEPRIGGQEDRSQVFSIVAARSVGNPSVFLYLEQMGRRADNSGTVSINEYDSGLRCVATVEGHDLCADPEGRRVCGILGRRETGPGAADLWVVVIETATGGCHSVHVQLAKLTGRRAATQLVGCDFEGRIYIFAREDYAQPDAPAAVLVYDQSGDLVANVPIAHWGSRDVFLEGRPIRVGPTGDIYVASATYEEGYRIEEYSWQK